MGISLGVMERVVLRAVRMFADESVPATRRLVACWVFDPDAFPGPFPDWIVPSEPPGRDQMSRFHRAVRSLERKELLRETLTTGVLEVTRLGYLQLSSPSGGPVKEKLDRQAVRQSNARVTGGQVPRADDRPTGWPPQVRAGAS